MNHNNAAASISRDFDLNLDQELATKPLNALNTDMTFLTSSNRNLQQSESHGMHCAPSAAAASPERAPSGAGDAEVNGAWAKHPSLLPQAHTHVRDRRRWRQLDAHLCGSRKGCWQSMHQAAQWATM